MKNKIIIISSFILLCLCGLIFWGFQYLPNKKIVQDSFNKIKTEVAINVSYLVSGELEKPEDFYNKLDKNLIYLKENKIYLNNKQLRDFGEFLIKSCEFMPCKEENLKIMESFKNSYFL